ncbi:MAG TPA: carbohydrate binding domain-containing protein [Hymenobacter sp.]|nr:carbohydrate binding domain-containing protein [Hymenobacter sp.]
MVFLVLFSCSSNEKESSAILASNDFDSLAGWTGGIAIPSLTRERAHSGKYSVKVDPTGSEYSNGYSGQLKELSDNKLKKINISAWVYLPDGNASAVLVTQIIDPSNNKTLLWEALNFTKEIKTFNKWVKVEQEVTLPDNISYNSVLNVYMWRATSTKPVFMDDLIISKVE